MVAASAALTISGVPFMGPIGAARVGYVDGEYVLNLAVDRRADCKLDLVMAGTARRRADGRIGSPGALRGGDARRRHVRPRSQSRRSSRRSSSSPNWPPRTRAISPPPDHSALEKRRARGHRGRPARRLQDHQEGSPLRRGRCRQGQGARSTSPQSIEAGDGFGRGAGRSRSTTSRPRSSAGTSSTPSTRIDGRDLDHGPPDRRRSRRAAAHPRLGPVHPRRDPGAGRGHARHRRRRAVSSTASKAPTR